MSSCFVPEGETVTECPFPQLLSWVGKILKKYLTQQGKQEGHRLGVVMGVGPHKYLQQGYKICLRQIGRQEEFQKIGDEWRYWKCQPGEIEQREAQRTEIWRANGQRPGVRRQMVALRARKAGCSVA